MKVIFALLEYYNRRSFVEDMDGETFNVKNKQV